MTEPATVSDPPPASPAAPAPAASSGPSTEQVRTLIRQELADFFGGLGRAPIGTDPAPDLSSDKKVEEYVEKLVAEKMKLLGAPPADPVIDPSTVPPVTPEVIPETKKSWQDKIRTALWGE